MLVAMATGYLDRSLKNTQYFRNLEQTEKVGVSFLLGEAFTHWYAQARMGIEFLLHVAPLASIFPFKESLQGLPPPESRRLIA